MVSWLLKAQFKLPYQLLKGTHCNYEFQEVGMGGTGESLPGGLNVRVRNAPNSRMAAMRHSGRVKVPVAS